MRKATQFAVLAVILGLVSAPAFAIPGKTEWSFGGTYVNPDESKAVWTFNTDIFFPVTPSGIVVLGPVFRVSSDDAWTAGGLGLEVNVPGQNGGFFFGGHCQYYLDSLTDDSSDHACDGRVGIKLPITEHALFKPFVDIGLSGRSRDADLSGGVQAVIKF